VTARSEDGQMQLSMVGCLAVEEAAMQASKELHGTVGLRTVGSVGTLGSR
jgi:hypothetical protein